MSPRIPRSSAVEMAATGPRRFRAPSSYCCPTAAKFPIRTSGGLSLLLDLQVKKRADERTRTADLLIASVRSVVAEDCTGLQIPHV